MRINDPDPLTDLIADCLLWQVIRSHSLGKTTRINSAEVHGIISELKHLCQNSLHWSRHVNFVDSLVGLCAWAKGRSSSFVLNGLLRVGLSWTVIGLKVDTKHNPWDHPHGSSLCLLP